jgi:predicted RNA-binding protein with PUA-like domain
VAYWLFKQEPSSYSYFDLERDNKTTCDGVTNSLALKNLRAAKRGDMSFFYHTGEEKQIVGVMEVMTDAYADPKDKAFSVVDVRPAGRLQKPVTLSAIKVDKAFSKWELVCISRLSVMPVPPKLWNRIMQMAGN